MVQRGAGLSCSPFPNNSPARPALGKGLGVGALPRCSIESFQDKALRFTEDPTLVGDELRSLLREVRKCYYQHDHPNVNDEWAVEAAYDEWHAFGCNEWFCPIPELELGVLDEIAGWAVRLQRAARIAVSRKLSGVSPALDFESIGKLARCVTPSWCQQSGNELMRVHATLTDHVEAFTHAVDDWVFENLSTPTEETANTSPPVENGYDGVVERVARYFQDVKAAVEDWRALLQQFDETFELTGGPRWSDLESDPTDAPYEYLLVNTSGGNLIGCRLADEIREFSKATQRVGKYVTTDRSERVDVILLETWAHEIESAFTFEARSEALVVLTIRVREAFEQFAEEVECDAAVASLSIPDTCPPKIGTPNNAPVEPNQWSDADRDTIRDALTGQQLKLFNVLWDFNSITPDRWKYYGDLKAIRAEKVWRTQPDSDEISDATVFEALRKLQKAMPPESPYVVTIENESRRVKLQR